MKAGSWQTPSKGERIIGLVVCNTEGESIMNMWLERKGLSETGPS